ncbi:MAG: hypothetical protein SFU25_03685 [Candidatus Caenarcaniphilales bacterium]|nr:hypothetical protein [Candidatus Caenarcaniphilales bacterium]
MKKQFILLSSLFFLLSSSIEVISQSDSTSDINSKVAKLSLRMWDKNGDKKLSKEEAKKSETITSKFDLMDADSDGYLSFSEIANPDAGYNKKKAIKKATVADSESSGEVPVSVTKDSTEASKKVSSKRTPWDKTKTVFAVHDADKNGKLTREELAKRTTILKKFDKYDINKDDALVKSEVVVYFEDFQKKLDSRKAAKSK